MLSRPRYGQDWPTGFRSAVFTGAAVSRRLWMNLWKLWIGRAMQLSACERGRRTWPMSDGTATGEHRCADAGVVRRCRSTSGRRRAVTRVRSPGRATGDTPINVAGGMLAWAGAGRPVVTDDGSARHRQRRRVGWSRDPGLFTVRNAVERARPQRVWCPRCKGTLLAPSGQPPEPSGPPSRRLAAGRPARAAARCRRATAGSRSGPARRRRRAAAGGRSGRRRDTRSSRGGVWRTTSRLPSRQEAVAAQRAFARGWCGPR